MTNLRKHHLTVALAEVAAGGFGTATKPLPHMQDEAARVAADLRELAAYKQAVNEAMTGDWFECAQFIDRRARELLEDNP